MGRLSNLQPPRGSRMFWIFFGMVGDNSAALVWDRSVVGCRIRSYIHCILCTPQPKMYISMHCTSAFHIYHAVFLDIVDVLSSSAGTDLGSCSSPFLKGYCWLRQPPFSARSKKAAQLNSLQKRLICVGVPKLV